MIDIRVENMVTTSSLEDLEVDLNGAMSNYLRLALIVLLSSLLIYYSVHVVHMCSLSTCSGRYEVLSKFTIVPVPVLGLVVLIYLS